MTHFPQTLSFFPFPPFNSRLPPAAALLEELDKEQQAAGAQPDPSPGPNPGPGPGGRPGSGGEAAGEAPRGYTRDQADAVRRCVRARGASGRPLPLSCCSGHAESPNPHRTPHPAGGDAQDAPKAPAGDPQDTFIPLSPW